MFNSGPRWCLIVVLLVREDLLVVGSSGSKELDIVRLSWSWLLGFVSVDSCVFHLIRDKGLYHTCSSPSLNLLYDA